MSPLRTVRIRIHRRLPANVDPTDTPRKFFSSCLLKDSTFAPSRIPGATVTHVHLPRKSPSFLRSTDNVAHRDSSYKSLPISRRICDSVVTVSGTLTEKLVCVRMLVFCRGRTLPARKGTSNETRKLSCWSKTTVCETQGKVPWQIMQI